MDPIEFRLINAYRDGDMKAHRKEVEGAALVEVRQAAAKQQLAESAGTSGDVVIWRGSLSHGKA